MSLLSAIRDVSLDWAARTRRRYCCHLWVSLWSLRSLLSSFSKVGGRRRRVALGVAVASDFLRISRMVSLAEDCH